MFHGSCSCNEVCIHVHWELERWKKLKGRDIFFSVKTCKGWVARNKQLFRPYEAAYINCKLSLAINRVTIQNHDH